MKTYHLVLILSLALWLTLRGEIGGMALAFAQDAAPIGALPATLPSALPAAPPLPSAAPSDVVPAGAAPAGAAPGTPPNIIVYIHNEMELLARARINQASPSKRAQTPLISAGSDSLIEHSAVPDLFSFAANYASAFNNGSGRTTIPSLSFTAYALLHGASLDPVTYERYRALRKLSFSVAQDATKTGSAAGGSTTPGSAAGAVAGAAVGGTTPKDPIWGVKYLLVDRRDASHSSNRKLLAAISQQLDAYGVALLKVRRLVIARLYENLQERDDSLVQGRTVEQFSAALASLGTGGVNPLFQAVYPKITTEDRQMVEDAIARSGIIESALRYDETVRSTIQQLESNPQWALSLQTKRQQDGHPDDYLAGLVYEVGRGGKSNLTFNASYGRQTTSGLASKTGLKLAAGYEVPLDVVPGGAGKGPRRFSLSVEANNTVAPQIYKAQAKLSIPLADGIEIPLSVTTANRREFINEGKVQGRIGLTFDLEKFKLSNLLNHAPAPTPPVPIPLITAADTPSPLVASPGATAPNAETTATSAETTAHPAHSRTALSDVASSPASVPPTIRDAPTTVAPTTNDESAIATPAGTLTTGTLTAGVVAHPPRASA
ncbi:MAG: hypothetical protein JOZ57_08875, partial [Abitibacteriaceae bacterium]|nr:hypothetical protein [Abditibacteriaceae bacterium]